MKIITKVLLALASAAGMLCILGVYALFSGYFDHGRFDIKQVHRSSSGKFAILAERSDNQALGGLTFFVVTGDDFPSLKKLREQYHSEAVVFAASSTCLDLHWQNASTLVIECRGSYLKPEYIDTEKTQSAEVNVSYVNISPDTAKTFRPN